MIHGKKFSDGHKGERFVDRKDIKKIIPHFIQRKYGISLMWMVAAFIVGGGSMYALLYITSNMAFIGAIFCCIFLCLAIFCVVTTKHSRDLLMATEFQNSIFAAAARMHCKFSIIIDAEGNTLYMDPKFQAFFSRELGIESEGIKALLAHKGIRDNEKITLTDAIKNRTPAVIPFYSEEKTLFLHVNMLTPDTIVESSILIDPLERPAGFYFIRCLETDKEEALQFMEPLEIGLYVMERTGKMLYMNPYLSHLLGYETQEVTNNAILMHYLCTDTDILSTLLKTEKLFTGHVVLRAKKENTHSVWIKQINLPRKKGEPLLCGICIARAPEGTDASMVASLTPDAQREWKNLLDRAPVAVALLTGEGDVLWSNQSFLNLASEQNPSGWNAHRIIEEEREGDFQSLLQEALSSEKVLPKPFEMKMMRDKERTTTWYLQKMEDMGHTPPCVIACVMDSTEQKNLELRFVHSQKMQAVGQLAGGIAHDFNNLLTAMIGFCDLLLLKHPAGDSSFSDIMQIKQNANRAAGLVRQLLAFSRKQTLQPEVLDLADVLAEISNLIRRLIGENIELNIIHGRDLHFVKVDQGQLEQVIINLAVNARDAMLNGGVLTIRTDNVVVNKARPISSDFIPPTDEDEIIDGDYVLIEVTDTGCGMSRAVIDKIFEPFFSTKEVGSGTGLGLSTVYGIIKQTDGYIYVKSSEGKGSSFSIFLKTTEGEKTKKESDDKLPLQDLTGKGTILLVEDEAPVRIFSSSALTGKGYNVLEADCAEIALDIIETHKGQIDLIITDVIMPGINGPTMIEEVHALYPSIKVIFMSGYAEDALVKAQGDGSSFHFVPKPFTLKQLASKVKEVLKGE